MSTGLIKVIDSLMVDVNNGKLLADGLQKYEYLFGSFFVNIVRVGEASGTLSKNFLYLSDELKKSKDLQNKVRSAMVYPVIILVMTLGVTSFLAFLVCPKLLAGFANLDVQLPITTRIMLVVLGFMRLYLVYLIPGIILFIIGVKILLKKVVPIKYMMDRLIIATPILGSLSVGLNMVNLTRVFGLLLRSGVKIVEAVNITSKTFEKFVYKRALLGAKNEIQKSGQLATYIVKW